MNFKRDCKNEKKFIRNGAQPLPKNVHVETKISEYEISDSDGSVEIKTPEPNRIEVDVALGVPAKNSLKSIEKRMEKVENLEIRKLKSHTDLTRDERTTFNEKVTARFFF